MKKPYQVPTLKVVEFKFERGFALSFVGCSHEGFEGELWGHEGFYDVTPETDDIDDSHWTTF